ncbi:MAG: hypothetical protein R6V77_07885 [Candidatus Cloacimonadaceae bacterium]
MTDKQQNKTMSEAKSKFSLTELLSIILLVGLIFVFIIPVRQAKISSVRVSEAATMLKSIGDKAEDFRNNPENGYYPDISQLNLGSMIESDYFEYSIVSDDSTVVAETKPAFGKQGAALVYSLSAKQYRIGKDESDQISQKFINENWLP